jgi:hypothetical protein
MFGTVSSLQKLRPIFLVLHKNWVGGLFVVRLSVVI